MAKVTLMLPQSESPIALEKSKLKHKSSETFVEATSLKKN